MGKIFILGTGFSKAISETMPTMAGLAEHVRSRICELPGDSDDHRIYENLVSDVEALLTYLFGKMPWKDPEKVHLDRAAFVKLSRLVSGHISDREDEAFETEPQEWSRQFIEYLHREKLTVATFNYDTVFEKLWMGLELNWSCSPLYRMPLRFLRERVSKVFGSEKIVKTCRLLKLHGSTNWYFSGDENAPGQQVYYDLVKINTGTEPEVSEDEIETLRAIRDKAGLVPLIIPPVAEKSSFYGTRLVMTLWAELRDAINEANEIYFVGYSLPKTDLTTSLFLSATIGRDSDKIIYIVDNATGCHKDRLIENYSNVFGEQNLNLDYLGMKEAVERMVGSLA